jgi:hypothetical protein
MAKTVIEKQIQAYGEFQRQIRAMSKAEQLKYASPGSEQGKEYQRLVADEDARRALRDKAIKEFDKANKPMYGNTRDLSQEQVNEIAKLSADYTKRRREFLLEISDKLNLSGYDLK